MFLRYWRTEIIVLLVAKIKSEAVITLFSLFCIGENHKIQVFVVYLFTLEQLGDKYILLDTRFKISQIFSFFRYQTCDCSPYSFGYMLIFIMLGLICATRWSQPLCVQEFTHGRSKKNIPSWLCEQKITLAEDFCESALLLEAMTKWHLTNA